MREEIYEKLIKATSFIKESKTKEELEKQLSVLKKADQENSYMYLYTKDMLDNYERIIYYGKEYSNYKYLTNEQFKNACETYNLKTIDAESYGKDFIKAHNIDDIINFKINPLDIIENDKLTEFIDKYCNLFSIKPNLFTSLNKINFENLKDFGIKLQIIVDEKVSIFDEEKILNDFKKNEKYNVDYNGIVREQKIVDDRTITFVEVMPQVESVINPTKNAIGADILFLKIKDGYLLIAEI